MAARNRKVYAVTDNSGKTVFVAAVTSSSALAFVVSQLRKQFAVEQATTEQLIEIGRTGTTLHDADSVVGEPAAA